MIHSILHKRFLGAKVWEILAVCGCYFVLSVVYHLTIWVSSGGPSEGNYLLFNVKNYIDSSGLDYTIQFVLTIPVWYLIFRVFSKSSILFRLIIHLVTLPVYIFVFVNVSYNLNKYFNFYVLESYGRVWDYYIPSLFYLIQFGIFHTYEYYQRNRRNLEKQAVLKEAALTAELTALKAQLNPHFLYNTFNSISASVPPEQENTREMIATLADLFRYQLKASKLDLVPLKDEIDFIKKYLALEQSRFGDKLKVTYDIPERVMEAKVPPMILQPLVENSIRHGLSSLIEGGEILIRIKYRGERLHFHIADTGVGMKDKSMVNGCGVGLKNTMLRLEKMYGTQMNLSDNDPSGLKIEFEI